MAEATLSLSTTVEPELQITIDGEYYTLRTHPSTPEALRDRDLGEELKRLWEKRGDDRKAEDDDRIEEISKLLISRFVDAPVDVLEKLPAEEQVKLTAYVTKLIKGRRDPTDGGEEQPPD